MLNIGVIVNVYVCGVKAIKSFDVRSRPPLQHFQEIVKHSEAAQVEIKIQALNITRTIRNIYNQHKYRSKIVTVYFFPFGSIFLGKPFRRVLHSLFEYAEIKVWKT